MIVKLDSPALARGFSSLEGARLVPTGLIGAESAASAVAAGEALWLAGGPLAYTRLRLLWREEPNGGPAAEAEGSLQSLRTWASRTDDDGPVEAVLASLSRPRAPIAGLEHRRPRIVGVLNVTPDSFSDGGKFETASTAIDHGLAMIDAGADMLDIGGESTRPGADTVTASEQCRRILPVIESLANRIPLSVDTRSAEVMRQALRFGASVVNDVSALGADPAAIDVVAESGCPVILMHSLGSPKSMQDAPRYQDVRLDIADYLERRIAACLAHGIAASRIVIDPGIGFGQTVGHIALLMRDLGILHGLGCPVMLGASRKSFIGRVDRPEPADRRIGGSVAAALLGIAQGVQYLRVHDVAETRQALAIWCHGAGHEIPRSNS